MNFSILITYKNKKGNEKYIERCLESIADQTYNDYEVILVHNDIEYISGLIKNNTLNIKTIEMKESDGISKYKNKAIEHATGEFLIFIDADDFLHPNALIYAKQMIEDNGLERNVFKFGISKTNLDKTSTLNTNKRAFFDNEALTKLEEIFKDVDIELNNQQVKSFVNGMFEKGIIGHKFTDYSPGNYFKKLNYQFRVHSYIIRKSFLIQNDIQFDNENLLYNDIPFLLELYNKTPYIIQSNTKLYYKFIHNDPINAPSLTQEEHEDRILQRVRALKEGLLKCIDPEIAKKVKIEAMRYYLYKVIKSDLFTDFSSEMYEIYQLLNEIFNYPSNEIKLSKRHSFEINAIKNGNLKKAFMLSKSRVLGYKTYQFMKPKNQRFRQKKVQKNVFTKLPIKENTILYESFLGRNYSDSPKAIFTYLLENDKDKWNHVWILNDKNLVENEQEFKNENVKIIKRFGWQYFYYVTVSKYFILNMRQPKWLYKKAEQIILSTWHGTPLKRLVFDMENVTSANKNYKKDFYNQSRNWDYLIAANKYSEQIFESAFMYPKENILTYGYPRNDILHNYTSEYKHHIKEKLNLPTSKKVILYAPTWRDDEFHSAGNYKFKLQMDLNRMRKEFGEEYVIALRMHYFISDNIDLTGFEDFAYDFSKYNDINDLYISSDILITDYSSVFFDFANLRKPILFFTYDIEKYQSMLRGFYIDVNNDLPGPLLRTNDELIEAIKQIDLTVEKYKEKYETFYQKYCYLEDGNATKRIVDKVIK
ncbi:CDP-glycerol glycerophosphotransferase family protein [Staphylococcus gallinarum]|uniref:CDP-glycerol:glycerophosphate glycerophosphotransferase n=8 Tax=Staphylococcus gallinarum TaxID=1293 RepID=A0A2T4SWL9_STAGA|nr:CDP-glycerol:glycerophosphate glycerophosphotransferase [Staphylococcus gallinarum]MCD8821252.1 CDP-glycerol:glycerophosphate glycerophosphotransferase [Staphylococcus gallinarum]PTL07440.1 teichoic acid biosynthesis protein F [Staphylococcus gallinarum]PTL09339.1 teichoic acid biosynthesis protein F [Staphylococcus gallinarum]RIL19576.1 CDP-glycerol:glycerophosphate glycerophosphotransferase [Staphylococcus gallinarum]RIL42878.1 CDP-glycerol:glycerophosphate glycerophosphotransferase [Stap